MCEVLLGLSPVRLSSHRLPWAPDLPSLWLWVADPSSLLDVRAQDQNHQYRKHLCIYTFIEHLLCAGQV